MTQDEWDEFARVCVDAVIERQRATQRRRESARKSTAAGKGRSQSRSTTPATRRKKGTYENALDF